MNEQEEIYNAIMFPHRATPQPRFHRSVEPEAITPEALRREGFQLTNEGNWWYPVTKRSEMHWSKSFRRDGHVFEVCVEIDEHGAIAWVAQQFNRKEPRQWVETHGVKTMQDLRTLVRFLGGAE